MDELDKNRHDGDTEFFVVVSGGGSSRGESFGRERAVRNLPKAVPLL